MSRAEGRDTSASVLDPISPSVVFPEQAEPKPEIVATNVQTMG
jgi:hypothetical protein